MFLELVPSWPDSLTIYIAFYIRCYVEQSTAHQAKLQPCLLLPHLTALAGRAASTNSTDLADLLISQNES